jgi:hypothetical protein
MSDYGAAGEEFLFAGRWVRRWLFLAARLESIIARAEHESTYGYLATCFILTPAITDLLKVIHHWWPDHGHLQFGRRSIWLAAGRLADLRPTEAQAARA